MASALMDAVRKDFVHYRAVHGASRLRDLVLLPLRQPALLALWVHRYGRWVHHGERRRASFHRLLYSVSFELVRHLTGVLIFHWVRLEEEVWIESHHPVIVSSRRIGRGSFIFGGVTLGASGLGKARGVPSVGVGVVLGPGAICIGPVEIPDGSVLAPNAIVTRSLPQPGAGWVGAPAARFGGPHEALVPRIGGPT